MYWANFLHFYQPPTQTLDILTKVTNEAYRKILAGLLENPSAKLTLNINGVLTEMLAENGFLDVINSIRTLLERGQIELTASAKYHPLLPKIPKDLMIHQIKINDESHKKYFGSLYKPLGFFPPEMGFDLEVGRTIKELGYSWVIVDELSCPEPLNHKQIYKDVNGLYYFFRERGPSFKILSAQLGTAQSLLREFDDRINSKEYMLTAMDGETFGHHRLGLEQLLLEIYKSRKLPTVKVSELIDLFPNSQVIEPRSSTWALMPKDIAMNIPFSRWDDPTNVIHQKQWELTNLAIKLVNSSDEEEQRLLDVALHSDQYWWASAKPWWSLEMIERGAFELLTAIRNFKQVTEQDKKLAWDLYIDIITTGFEWQRNGTVANLSKLEDEEIKERMEQDRPFLSTSDYKQMIETLESQMLAAAADHEYARAELLRKRVEELTAEMKNTPNAHQNDIRINQ